MSLSKILRNTILLIILVVSISACSTVPELSETYTSGDGSLTLAYPEAWSVLSSMDGTVFLSNQEDVLAGDEALQEGTCVLALMVLPSELVKNDLQVHPRYQEVVKSDPPTAQEIMQLLMVDLNLSEEPAEKNFSINDHKAYQIFLPAKLTEKLNDINLLMIDMGESTFIFSQTNAPVNKMDTCEPITNAIVETINYQP